jgi:hypothetical protein
LDLGLANPPRNSGAKFGVCPALRDEVSPEPGSWRLELGEVPPCHAQAAPAPGSLLFRAFFILHSSFSHRGMDIDGPWLKILKIFIVFIINDLRQSGPKLPDV